MFGNRDIPVYLFTGFLESGKSTCFQEILEEGNFEDGLRTLYLMTEEGEKEVDEMEELARIAKQNRKEKTAADVKEYTSKFESMADASNKQEEPQVSKPKKEKVEEEKKPVEVKKFNYEDMKPIYSEEELAEIEEQEYEDENAWDDDVDYEEYDEYYDD